MTELELKLVEEISKQLADLSKLVNTLMTNQLTLQGHIKDIYLRMGLKVQRRKPDATC